ncbi:hypothetical protein DFO70_12339 [Cytobacillus firmus]|uniref:Uncharacterized protein n=2 Tax=Cytobacillus TaxID=2675230 RepID=A0A366JLN6_CYTFI|nr:MULTISPECIES: hypothetical protein [Cytobacillus]RBP86890.1 hypothetical protein DFO70_12339 [Cytobacillus firmus]TDX36544.1 hypothetical protein DFO72_11840 [Cytobacillus oceanisediminis]
MIKQDGLIVIFSWMFAGMLLAKVSLFLTLANIHRVLWIEYHSSLTIITITLLFGICGFFYVKVKKNKKS